MSNISYRVDLRSDSVNLTGNSNLFVVENNTERDVLSAVLNDICFVLTGSDGKMNVNIKRSDWVEYPIEQLQSAIASLNVTVSNILVLINSIKAPYTVRVPDNLSLVPAQEKINNRFFVVEDYYADETEIRALYIYNSLTFILLCIASGAVYITGTQTVLGQKSFAANTYFGRSVFIDNAGKLYFGDIALNNSWRIYSDSGSLKFEKRIAGVWELMEEKF
jgi:hypothetical protein